MRQGCQDVYLVHTLTRHPKQVQHHSEIMYQPDGPRWFAGLRQVLVLAIPQLCKCLRGPIAVQDRHLCAVSTTSPWNLCAWLATNQYAWQRGCLYAGKQWLKSPSLARRWRTLSKRVIPGRSRVSKNWPQYHVPAGNVDCT